MIIGGRVIFYVEGITKIMDDEQVGVDLPVWQDREIRFDIINKILKLRLGETVVDKINYVEDTKGNNGITGKFYVTNLRLIWISLQKQNINLSIGLKCITQVRARQAVSKLKGQTESVNILTKSKDTQFEFIFTNLVSDNPRLFSTITSIQRAYETSKLYREVKLRGAIVENKSLKLLPLEQVYNKINGVMNLSNDQGVLGVLYITNVRVAWHANTNLTYSLSIPYIQMKNANVRRSKFGAAFVVETLKDTGYVLGFRIDPADKLKAIQQEVNRMYMVFSQHPVFGVEYHKNTSDFNEDIEEPPQDMEKLQLIEEEGDVVCAEEKTSKFATYFADSNKFIDREPVFSHELGLAIEKLPDGYTLQELWEVR